MALLAAAGLLRPEAWVLAGLYWLWCLPGRALRERAGLSRSSRSRRSVGARRPRGDGRPAAQPARDPGAGGRARARARARRVPPRSDFLADLARPPVALAGVSGSCSRVRRFGPRAWRCRLALLGAGALTFVATGVAGLSIIPRYLTVPAVALCVLAGYAVLGLRR